jgi:hypothetical protein
VQDAHGGLLNPQATLTFPAGLDPTAVVAGRFGPGPNLDLAVLDAGRQQVLIFSGDGHGSFTETAVVPAGNAPTGLALADISRPGGGRPDGIPDLVIGNQFGDVLVLPGKGDGTFEPFQRLDAHIALAVAHLTGNGQTDFIYANQARDHVSVQFGGSPPSLLPDPSHSILGPGAITLADLNGDGIPDLIVANTGSNNILVYPGLGNGQFGPEGNGGKGFAAGTNPVGVTVADVNGDGIPDLVAANEGSNDVSILLGQGRGAGWTLIPGPRLQAGLGPVSTAVGNFTGNGLPDILVTNSESNTVTLIPGVGGGFFNDQNPTTFHVGTTPVQTVAGDFTKPGQLDLVTVNRDSNNLTVIPNFTNPAAAEFSISSAGDDPVAAVAVPAGAGGLDDLVVANNGDGIVSLLLGSPAGLSLADPLSFADLAHATDLAEVSDSAGSRVFGVGDVSETATLLFTFGVGLPTPNISLLPVQPGPALVTQPLPLENSAFPIVAVVLSVSDLDTILPPAAEAPLAVAADSPTVVVGAGPQATAPFDPGNGTAEPAPDAAGSAADGDLSAMPELMRLVIGLDDALRRSRQDVHGEQGRVAPAGVMDGALDAVFGAGLPLAAAEVDGVAQVLSSAGAVALEGVATARDTVMAAVGLPDVALPDFGVEALIQRLSRALHGERHASAGPAGPGDVPAGDEADALLRAWPEPPLPSRPADSEDAGPGRLPTGGDPARPTGLVSYFPTPEQPAGSFASAGLVTGLWYALRTGKGMLTRTERGDRGPRLPTRRYSRRAGCKRPHDDRITSG